MADAIIISTAQRRKVILGKVFCEQHDLFDLIFKDSFDNKHNNFINLYERSVNYSPNENLLFEVNTDFREKIFLQWNHGTQGPDGYPTGMRFPGFITYIKAPTTEAEPHKIIDIDLKNMINFVDPKYLQEYEEFVRAIGTANINSRLIPEKDVMRMHDIIEYVGNVINDEMSKYSWVGGVFWGGKGYSYWGDWSVDLMRGLSDSKLIDSDTNMGDRGYHAQRLSSVQFFKPTLVTNYLCGSGFENFKYSCPAFFVLKNENMYPILEKYYRLNFISTFKSLVPLDKQLKWQDGGAFDLNLWEAWREELKKMEGEIKTILFSDK
jgi:hypothetical protein